MTKKTPKNVQGKTPEYEEFYESVKKCGAIICGSIGCGKTVFAKHLGKKLIEDKKLNARITIFDTVGNWFYNFLPIPSQQINSVNDLPINAKQIVYRINMRSEDERIQFITKVFKAQFIRQRRLFDEYAGDLDRFSMVINIIEEANTILSTYSIRKGFLRDFIAFSRNFNIVNIFVMQRLADSSPKVTERIPNLVFGLVNGSNDKRRIKEIIPKHDRKKVDLTEKYHFYLCFEKNVEPYKTTDFKGERTDEYLIECITKGFLRKEQTYKVVPRYNLEQFASYCSKKSSRFELIDKRRSEFDLDEEMELDLGLLGEPDEEW